MPKSEHAINPEVSNSPAVGLGANLQNFLRVYVRSNGKAMRIPSDDLLGSVYRDGSIPGIEPISRFAPSPFPRAPRSIWPDSAKADSAIPKVCRPHPYLDALGKAWALPPTMLGIVAAAPSYLAGKVAGTHPRFQFGNKALQLVNSPLNINNRAYTLGNVQIYGIEDGPEKFHRSYSGAVVQNGRHEEGHSQQAQILRPLYLPTEVGAGMMFGNRNPFEQKADAYARALSCRGMP